MKMLISPDWLRNKIKTEPDSDFEAGMPVHALSSIDMFLPPNVVPIVPKNEERDLKLKHAFGLFINHLRLRDRLSIEALANQASVLAEELERIEFDPHYQPRPRTVVNLARTFGIERKKMMKLSGVAQATDDQLEDAVLEFAAKSAGVSTLSQEEQQELNEFIKYLNEA